MNITMSRTYIWQSENLAEQANFIDALVRLFRKVTGGIAALHLEGFQDTNGPRTPEASLSQSRSRASAPRLEPGPSATTSSARIREQTPPRIQPSPSNSQPDSVRSRQPVRPPEPVAPSTSSSSQVPSVNLPPAPKSSGPADRTTVENNDKSIARPSLDSVSSRSYSPQRRPALAPAGPRARPASPSVSNTSREPSNRSRVAATADKPQRRRGEHNDRVSFFDPANQVALDRLISGTAAGAPNEGDVEEESAQATMADVEEMLDGYELANDDMAGRRVSRGAADLIEARLLDELLATEKVPFHKLCFSGT